MNLGCAVSSLFSSNLHRPFLLVILNLEYVFSFSVSVLLVLFISFTASLYLSLNSFDNPGGVDIFAAKFCI